MSRRSCSNILYGTPSEFSGLAADRLHRVFCVFARRRYLGLPQRSLPKSGAGQGAESWKFLALVYECAHLRNLPLVSCVFRRVSLRVLCCDDGDSISCCSFLLSGDQRSLPRRDAEKARHRLSASPQRNVAYLAVCKGLAVA